MSRVGVVVITIVVAVLAASSPTEAQPIEFSIPIDTVVRQPPESITLLATFDVPAERQGLPCNADALNQDSEHPNNDLILESGGAAVVMEDVEATPNAVTASTGELVLGPTLSVSVRMGPDGVFSGGVLITVGCPSAAPTPTTPVTAAADEVPPEPAAPSAVVPAAGAPPAAPSAGAPPTVSPPMIPETGDDATRVMSVVGVALILAGGLLVGVAGSPRRTHGAGPRHSAITRTRP